MQLLFCCLVSLKLKIKSLSLKKKPTVRPAKHYSQREGVTCREETVLSEMVLCAQKHKPTHITPTSGCPGWCESGHWSPGGSQEEQEHSATAGACTPLSAWGQNRPFTENKTGGKPLPLQDLPWPCPPPYIWQSCHPSGTWLPRAHWPHREQS